MCWNYHRNYYHTYYYYPSVIGVAIIVLIMKIVHIKKKVVHYPKQDFSVNSLELMPTIYTSCIME